MSQVFFGGDQASNGLGLFYTFVILALSFFVRPLGGMILGPMGDKIALTAGQLSAPARTAGLWQSFCSLRPGDDGQNPILPHR